MNTDNIKKVMEIGFDIKQKPSMFLANLFKKRQLKGIKVELQGRVVKGYYSVDVKLGTGGRYNSLDEYSKRDFVVPEYNDIASLTEEDVFKAQFGQTEYDQVGSVINAINDGQEIFSDKQNRLPMRYSKGKSFLPEAIKLILTKKKHTKRAFRKQNGTPKRATRFQLLKI